MNSLSGQLLIASPKLADGNFLRTVVLVIQHQSEGALGLVLNRPSDRRLTDIWGLESDITPTRNLPVYVGGPVSGPLMALHGSSEHAELDVVDRVHFSASAEHITQIVSQKKHTYRIYSGYAGWGGGQLDDEMRLGGWLTAPAKREHVFRKVKQAADLWQELAGMIGKQILSDTLHIGRVPDDPSCN